MLYTRKVMVFPKMCLFAGVCVYAYALTFCVHTTPTHTHTHTYAPTHLHVHTYTHTPTHTHTHTQGKGKKGSKAAQPRGCVHVCVCVCMCACVCVCVCVFTDGCVRNSNKDPPNKPNHPPNNYVCANVGAGGGRRCTRTVTKRRSNTRIITLIRLCFVV